MKLTSWVGSLSLASVGFGNCRELEEIIKEREARRHSLKLGGAFLVTPFIVKGVLL